MTNNIIVGDEQMSVKCNGKCKYCFLSGDCRIERMHNSIKRHKRKIAEKDKWIESLKCVIGDFMKKGCPKCIDCEDVCDTCDCIYADLIPLAKEVLDGTIIDQSRKRSNHKWNR